jgi:hypothetical protein
MHAKDLVLDDGSNWETVEAINEYFPQHCIITSLALIVKSMYESLRRTLVVTS